MPRRSISEIAVTATTICRVDDERIRGQGSDRELSNTKLAFHLEFSH
jgi:hypothetical protein